MSNTSDFIGADPQGTVKATVSVASAIGDLYCLTESGNAVPASNSAGIINENNTVAGATALSAVARQEVNANYNKRTGRAKTIAELGNGNVVEVYTGDGTTATTNLNVRIHSLMGASIALIKPSTFAGITAHRVYKINATTFMVAWSEAAALKFIILNNDGTTALATVSVITASANGEYLWGCDIAANGDIIFAYSKSGPLVAFTRYNAAGTIQGVEVVIEAAVLGAALCVRALAAGGFVVYYYRATATNAWKFARYDATGVIQGALTTVLTSTSAGPTSAGGGNYEQLCVELSNGNLVFQAIPTADQYVDLYFYTGAGVLITSIDFGITQLPASEWASVAAMPGGVAVSHRNQTTGQFLRTYTFAGVALLPLTAVGTTGSGNGTVGNGSGTLLTSLGAAGFAMAAFGWDSGTPAADARLFCVSPMGALLGSGIVLEAASANQTCDGFTFLTSSGYLVLRYCNSAVAPTFGTYKVQRKAILGAALEAVAAQALCRFGTKGSYPLTVTFAPGANFDGRTAVVPGPRGTVIGATAQLFGLAT